MGFTVVQEEMDAALGKFIERNRVLVRVLSLLCSLSYNTFLDNSFLVQRRCFSTAHILNMIAFMFALGSHLMLQYRPTNGLYLHPQARS